VCEGEQPLAKGMRCVRIRACAVVHLDIGALCRTRCPAEFWGADCRKPCPCHAHGRCHPVTGECTCNPNRWGLLCQSTCRCSRHGHCHPTRGDCACDEGWWTPVCARPCQCFAEGVAAGGGAACDQVSGRCQCRRGQWGLKCSLSCNCHTSPCKQRNGECECLRGWWGPNCEQSCACDLEHSQCDSLDGSCLCQPGYKGAQCNQPCEAGTYGSGCKMSCGYCRDGQPCSAADGACVLVPLVLLLLVVLCCCLCCGGGSAEAKDRATVGDGSPFVRMKYHVYNVLANISASLPCISAWTSGLPRVTVSHHDPELTFNHSFIEPPSCGWVTEGSSFDTYGRPEDFHEMSSKCNMFLDPSGFSSEDMALGFSIPRTSSIAKSKRPSVSLRLEGTRFRTPRRAGAVRPGPGCRPHPPPSGPAPGVWASKAKMPWGALMLSTLNVQGGAGASRPGEEDIVSPGAEGGEDGAGEGGEENQESDNEGAEQDHERTHPQVPGASGRRRTVSNATTAAAAAAAGKGAQTPESPSAPPPAGVPEKVTTVYVTVGRAGRPTSKLETPSSEGPVQAVLRRLGSLQRHKEQDSGRPKVKSAAGVAKPPRRKLGLRVSVWEQQGGPVGGEGRMSKPSRKKLPAVDANANGSPASECDTAARPLLAVLKSMPETGLTDPGSGGSPRMELADRYDGGGEPGVTDPGYNVEVSANEATEASVGEEPSYENVLIKHS
ncbi:hypothetical protein CRUP_020231, partial [Coryphaenoides rupestris]